MQSRALPRQMAGSSLHTETTLPGLTHMFHRCLPCESHEFNYKVCPNSIQMCACHAEFKNEALIIFGHEETIGGKCTLSVNINHYSHLISLHLIGRF